MGKRKTPIGLTAAQLAKRAELIERLRACEPAIVDAMAQLSVALLPYNAVLREVADLAVEVSKATEAAVQERSEAWADTGPGAAADEFWCAWDVVADSFDTPSAFASRIRRFWRLPVVPTEVPLFSELVASLPDAPHRSKRR